MSARISTTFAAACALAFAPAALADSTADADLPVTRVTLYTSGVGYFERTGDVDGDSTETLLFPVDQVNDVLKSLVLLDRGGGAIQPVTYAAQDPLEKQLSGFSIDLGDNPDRATLLNRLRGADATVVVGAQTLTGTIVGVESRTIVLPNNEGTTTEDILNLLATDDLPSGGGGGGGTSLPSGGGGAGAGSLHSIPLADVTSISLNDPALNQELREALSVVAHGRDASKRPVKLSFSGHGKRTVMVGYLTSTPLWQTTYRLVLGAKPVVQGWALVQNTSQDDWTGVSLSLVSGRPISFIQDLYTPVYVPRTTVKAQVAEGAAPQAYNSNTLQNVVLSQTDNSVGVPMPVQAAVPAPTYDNYAAPGSFGGGGANGRTFNMPPRPTLDAREALQGAVNSAGAKLGTTLFKYEIKVPVTVPRQQSAMIPFVSSTIDAEAVSIYNHSVQADHPLAGARLKNTTGLHLMGGPMTVFDEGAGGTSYVGDALIDDTEPGQTRLISYAVDLPVDAAEEDDDVQQSLTFVIDRGTLVLTHHEMYKTTYTFKNNAGKARVIVVEQPYQGDRYKLIEPAKADEHTADYDRFDVRLAAGESKTFVVKEEHPEWTQYGLVDTDLGTLVGFCADDNIDPAVKEAIEQSSGEGRWRTCRDRSTGKTRSLGQSPTVRTAFGAT